MADSERKNNTIKKLLFSVDSFLEKYEEFEKYFHEQGTCVYGGLAASKMRMIWWPYLLNWKNNPIVNIDLTQHSIGIYRGFESLRVSLVINNQQANQIIETAIRCTEKIYLDIDGVKKLFDEYRKTEYKDWVGSYEDLSPEAEIVNDKFDLYLNLERQSYRMEQAGLISKAIDDLGLRELVGENKKAEPNIIRGAVLKSDEGAMAKHIDDCQTPDELSEAMAYHLNNGGMRRDIYNSTGLIRTEYDEHETKRLFGAALSKYNEIRKSYQWLPPLYIDASDPLSGLAQIQQLCKTEPMVEPNGKRPSIPPSVAAAKSSINAGKKTPSLIDGLKPDLFDWETPFTPKQIEVIEQKLGPMAKNIDELAEFIETADDFIKFDNSHWTDEGPCGPSSDTEKWIFSSIFSAKKLRLGLEKMMNAEEAKHFYLQLQIALNLKIDQRGVRVQLSGEYIPKENHSPLVKQIADHLKIKILASNKQLVPLSPNAQAIYDKLCSLRPTEAMTLPKIQDWWYEETGKNLDEGTFKKYRKELLPYGLKNKPRIGYYTQK